MDWDHPTWEQSTLSTLYLWWSLHGSAFSFGSRAVGMHTWLSVFSLCFPPVSFLLFRVWLHHLTLLLSASLAPSLTVKKSISLLKNKTKVSLPCCCIAWFFLALLKTLFFLTLLYVTLCFLPSLWTGFVLFLFFVFGNYSDFSFFPFFFLALESSIRAQAGFVKIIN